MGNVWGKNFKLKYGSLSEDLLELSGSLVGKRKKLTSFSDESVYSATHSKGLGFFSKSANMYFIR